MTEKELKDSLKAPCGGYFFYGDEDYLKDYYVGKLRQAVVPDDGFADFNDIPVSSDAFSPDNLRDLLASPPMMSDKKLIRVKLESYSSIKEDVKNGILEVLEELSDYPDTVLLISVSAGGFDAGTQKKPSSALKELSKRIKMVEFELQDDRKLYKWLERHFTEYGVTVGDGALSAMIKICGHNMYRLSGEADKVSAFVLSHGKSEVTPDTVAEVVSSTPEEDAYQFANAILSGDRKTALASLERYKKRGDSPNMVLGSVSSVICDMASISAFARTGADKRAIASALKMHEYRVGIYMQATSRLRDGAIESIVKRIADTDVKMKSTPLGYILLERLICTR